MNPAVPARVAVPDSVPRGPGLSPALRESVAALAEALFSTEDGPAPEHRVAWLCDELDHFFSYAGPRARLNLRLCLTGVSVLAPWMVGRPGGFTTMPVALRREAVERLERSPLGLAVFGAKAMLCIVWYEHPENAAFIGADGLCLRRRP